MLWQSDNFHVKFSFTFFLFFLVLLLNEIKALCFVVLSSNFFFHLCMCVICIHRLCEMWHYGMSDLMSVTTEKIKEYLELERTAVRKRICFWHNLRFNYFCNSFRYHRYYSCRLEEPINGFRVTRCNVTAMRDNWRLWCEHMVLFCLTLQFAVV